MKVELRLGTDAGIPSGVSTAEQNTLLVTKDLLPELYEKLPRHERSHKERARCLMLMDRRLDAVKSSVLSNVNCVHPNTNIFT